MDQSKKTMRHFYCRDVLWETFEQMANDFDCSIDYLVNEAMRYYARSKNYQSPGGPQMTGGAPVPDRPGNNTSGPNSYPPANKPAPRAGAVTNQPAPSMGSGAPGMAARRPAPPTPGYANTGHNTGHAPSSGGRPGASVAPGGHVAPAAPPAAPPMPPQMGSGGPTLFLIYNGQRYPVTKDQFIIGRGSKTSDLPIKDGNISRKHAAVIRRNGTFYIKDLGSTNGIDYKGMRIDNKRIDEGDVFHLCDYELRFTYRAD
jgi:hypothetical protein